MRSLTELANHYGSDKGTTGPSPQWPAHNYADVYEAYLGGLRHKPIRFLEIGLGVPGENWTANIAHGKNTGGGASIKTWYDYFPNAKIIGGDINPAGHLDNDRVTTYVLDQGDRAQLDDFVAKSGGDFDVIIDDGSHRPDHQQVTFAALFPHLKAGGLYFIEDLMRNGVGDPNRGRYSAAHVLNTRKLFRAFAQQGKFPEPNDLSDAGKLAADIESVAFHTPAIRISAELSFDVGAATARGARPMTE
ncbi:MAG: hypothetical protein ACRDVG_16310, partial [Jatrophihabitantaceae bacterium]